MYATCRTTDCGNEGHAIDVGALTFTDPNTGDTSTVDAVCCGVCGNTIDEVTDAPPFDAKSLDDEAATT